VDLLTDLPEELMEMQQELVQVHAIQAHSIQYLHESYNGISKATS
jgi:hypothetical protein